MKWKAFRLVLSLAIIIIASGEAFNETVSNDPVKSCDECKESCVLIPESENYQGCYYGSSNAAVENCYTKQPPYLDGYSIFCGDCQSYGYPCYINLNNDPLTLGCPDVYRAQVDQLCPAPPP